MLISRFFDGSGMCMATLDTPFQTDSPSVNPINECRCRMLSAILLFSVPHQRHDQFLSFLPFLLLDRLLHGDQSATARCLP